MNDTLPEHFGYLSDQLRLERFRLAISLIVSPGDLVADVGCGFGVLGLICLRNGAAHIWGIDSTAAIEIARETMQRAGLADSYTCIRERSFTASLPQPVDVIVCDHVGYFGIDYGIIETLGDARRRMLKPGGRIVPNQLRLVIAGASSAAGREKAEEWLASGIPAEYHWLREYAVNSKHARMFLRDEIVTEPVVLGAVDLTSDTPDLLAFEASLNVVRDGLLDGLAGWFECQLASDVWMTNSPLADDQINRDQVFLAFDKPVPVQAGDSVNVSVSIRHKEGIIAWTVKDPRSGHRQKQSNWSSLIVRPPELARSTEL